MATPDDPEQFVNNAIRHRNGTVSGNFTVADNTNYMSGHVVCFQVNGQVVRFAGRIAQSTNPNSPPGSFLMWTQVDNDVSARTDRRGPPDMTSQVYLTDAAGAAFHCAFGVNLTIEFSAVAGHIEIHPES